MANAKGNWFVRHKVWSVILTLLVVGLVASIASGKQPQTTPAPNPVATQPVQSTATKKEAPQAAPKYTVAHELLNHRYDGGANYYVLIDTVDVSGASFKDTVKAVIKDLAAKKGKKISIELHDDQTSLDVSYKQYGDMSLGRPRTDAENKLEERHFVASFDGELETNLYLNQLDFFPAATTKSVAVGQYVGSEEFKP